MITWVLAGGLCLIGAGWVTLVLWAACAMAGRGVVQPDEPDA
jgi:hypothetical protein